MFNNLRSSADLWAQLYVQLQRLQYQGRRRDCWDGTRSLQHPVWTTIHDLQPQLQSNMPWRQTLSALHGRLRSQLQSFKMQQAVS